MVTVGIISDDNTGTPLPPPTKKSGLSSATRPIRGMLLGTRIGIPTTDDAV